MDPLNTRSEGMDYNYMYDYNTTGPNMTTGDSLAGAAFFGVFLLFVLIFTVIAYAVSAFLLGRIFKKSGTPQWIAWVPVYNTWKTLELGNQQGFWAILAFIPFVNIVSAIFIYISMYHIGKKLGKEDWFVILAIFVPIVWLIWLGFDDSKWPKEPKAAKTVAAKA